MMTPPAPAAPGFPFATPLNNKMKCFYAYSGSNVLICGSQPPACLGISYLFDLVLGAEHLSKIPKVQ
jgi:hypothetical protein